MKDKRIFTKENYGKIYHSISKPAFKCGAPKFHNLKCKNINDLHLCVIIFSIDTYDYDLAKFLAVLLESLISISYYTKDSFINFNEEIKKAA